MCDAVDMNEVIERMDDEIERLRAENERLADEIERLRAENERLRKMVKNAYNDGFKEGMREVNSSRGGIPWSDCTYRAALAEQEKKQ